MKSSRIAISILLISVFIAAPCPAYENPADIKAAEAAGRIPKKFYRIDRVRKDDIAIAKPARLLPLSEKLTYRIKWLCIPVATITASINGIKKINGRDAYVLEATARTNKFCSAIYRVEDRYVSYLDVENLYTLRHEVYRREGRYKKDAYTDFDQVRGRAHFKNYLDKSEKDFDIPRGCQDPLSLAYYFRLVPIEKGRMIQYSVCNNEAVYQLYGVPESTWLVRVPGVGRMESFLLQPYAKLKGEDVKKGKAAGYFSCDDKRIPLMAAVKGPVFTEVIGYLDKAE